jgi:hypothetical protein
LNDVSSSEALRAAIRADMSARLQEIADRAEERAMSYSRIEDLEGILADALTEATRIIAEGVVARMREAPSTRG